MKEWVSEATREGLGRKEEVMVNVFLASVGDNIKYPVTKVFSD